MPFKPTRVFYPHFPKDKNSKPQPTLDKTDFPKYGALLAKRLFAAAMDDTGGDTLLSDFGSIVQSYDATGIYNDKFETFFKKVMAPDGLPSSINITDVYEIWANAMMRFFAISDKAFEIVAQDYDNDCSPDTDAKIMHQLCVPDPSTA